jgi:hypothetical protein
MILGYVFVRPEHSVLALCLWGLGYVGWLLTGAHMLGLLLFVTKWLTFCGAVVALPYAFGFKAWSILVSALVLSGLSIYSNRHHVPILLQKIMKSFH